MNDSHKSELLSAYLDGELSPAEQAEIEQYLESEPEAREVLEQLAQLGDFIRELPQQCVSESFSSRVMEDVRQHSAYASTGNTATKQVDSPRPASQRSREAEPATTDRPTTRRAAAPPGGPRRRHPLVWVALSAAAAVLLLIYPGGLFRTDGLQDRIASDGDEQQTEQFVGGDSRANGETLGNNGENEPPRADADPRQTTRPENALSPDRLVETPAPNPDQFLPNERLSSGERPRSVNPLTPGPGSATDMSPFVQGGFTAEDEKILRLLESLILVKIDCTPATAHAREFDKILRKYKIKLVDKATPKLPENAPPPEIEVYYIESTVTEAEAVLNEVRLRNTEFVSLALRTETLQTKNALNAEAGDQQAPADDEPTPSAPTAGPRGSFAEKFHLETPAELEALRSGKGQPPTTSSVFPFLQGQSDLDAVLGPSPVEAEHLVRMLVVLTTVEPAKEQ